LIGKKVPSAAKKKRKAGGAKKIKKSDKKDCMLQSDAVK
jgi:hypothetical protein